MRGLGWLAGMATASSLTAGAGAAAAAFAPRGLGGSLSRARLVGSRRSRSSATAATAGFVGATSTRTRPLPPQQRQRQRHHQQHQREHISTLAMALAARRPRTAAPPVFSKGWVATAGKAGRSSRRMFSSISSESADVGSTTAAVVDGGYATMDEEGEEEDEPSPFKVGFQKPGPDVDAWVQLL